MTLYLEKVNFRDAQETTNCLVVQCHVCFWMVAIKLFVFKRRNSSVQNTDLCAESQEKLDLHEEMKKVTGVNQIRVFCNVLKI